MPRNLKDQKLSIFFIFKVVSLSRLLVSLLTVPGNASSLPPRLPFLSPVLRMLSQNRLDYPVKYIMVCCSYRGFWTSNGRPSEKGIALDAEATLRWIEKEGSRQAPKGF